MTKDEMWAAIKAERREDDWRQPEIVGFLAGMRAAARIRVPPMHSYGDVYLAFDAGAEEHASLINLEVDALERKE